MKLEARRLSKTFNLVGERLNQPELLDLGQGTIQDVAANLAEMQRINDFLGGTRALTRHLFPRLLLHNGPVTVLDVGTGGGGLPLLLASWARRLKLPLRVLAVDWSGRNLRAGRLTGSGAEILPVQADALSLPLGECQVDYVISSLFLHHLSPEILVRVLRESYRLARVAVIMSDLVRGWLPYLAFQLVQPVFARNYLTRHDGALSIRRAYTAEELGRLAVRAGIQPALSEPERFRAGLPGWRVYTHFPWRMTLVAQK